MTAEQLIIRYEVLNTLSDVHAHRSRAGVMAIDGRESTGRYRIGVAYESRGETWATAVCRITTPKPWLNDDEPSALQLEVMQS